MHFFQTSFIARFSAHLPYGLSQVDQRSIKSQQGQILKVLRCLRDQRQDQIQLQTVQKRIHLAMLQQILQIE